MNVVIDTSVWISALISSNGSNREVIRRALQRSIMPQMGEKLFLEYESVMKRSKTQDLCPLNETEQNALSHAYVSVCQWNEIYFLWRPNLKDESDNHLIELAVASSSKTIITNNVKDFQDTGSHFDIDIVTPESFIRSNA